MVFELHELHNFPFFQKNNEIFLRAHEAYHSIENIIHIY